MHDTVLPMNQQGTGRVEDWPQINARVPRADYDYISALAKRNGLSRNRVIRLLVEHAREQNWQLAIRSGPRELESA